jgi:hypothetical protein
VERSWTSLAVVGLLRFGTLRELPVGRYELGKMEMQMTVKLEVARWISAMKNAGECYRTRVVVCC